MTDFPSKQNEILVKMLAEILYEATLSLLLMTFVTADSVTRHITDTCYVTDTDSGL